MVAQRRWSDGQFELAFFSQKVNGFFGDSGVEGSFFFEPWKQFAHGTRVQQRARETMLADLSRLFEHVDILFAELRARILRVMSINQLREAQGASHTGRTTADDDNIGRHLRAFDAFYRLAEN